MAAKRGFEFTSKFQAERDNAKKRWKDGSVVTEQDRKVLSVELPTRSTAESAGYDFQANEYITIPSVWKQATKYMFNKLFSGGNAVDSKLFKPTLVPTGVKSYMGRGEYLALFNRSSNPLKRFLVLTNGVGVIDKDYYNNPEDDGHIMFQFLNFGIFDQTISPGDKVGQGVFMHFLEADNDNATGERTGGHGSTGN